MGRCPAQPKCGLTCFATVVFRNFPGFLPGRSQVVLPLAMPFCMNRWEENAPWVWSPQGSRHEACLGYRIQGASSVHGLVSMSSEDWRAKKGRFDVWTVRTWPHQESSNRAKLSRDHELNEFWQIFVNDRPVRREATQTQTFAQSRSVFSYAMTVMDKIDGWEEEWMGSRFAACMWIYTKAVLCGGQESAQERLLKATCS